MKIKKLRIVLGVIIILFISNQSSWSQSTNSSEETELKKYEVGGHFTIMFQDDFETSDVIFKRLGFNERVIIDKRYESGFGGRFTYNINRNLAIEGEVNFTPSTRTRRELALAGVQNLRAASGGEKTQFLGGVKYGVRQSKYGVFAKIRPGFIRFNAFPKTSAIFTVPSPTGGQPLDALLVGDEKPATFFNVDVGGVFEYYPTRKIIVRFDIGDTIIHYNAQEPKSVNPNFTRHNLQMNLGIGFRF